MKSAAQPRERTARLPTFNVDLIARAEQAVQTLSVEFDDWMREELARLIEARRCAREANLAEDDLVALHVVAHDIKGAGATYNFPLATLIAKSLCNLLESEERREKARSRPALIDAHIDAIRAIVGARVRSHQHHIGGELLAELERQVDELTNGLV
jgi:hypothetical protein